MKLKHILLGLVISLISWCALAAAVAPSSSQLVVLAYHEIDQNSPASDVNAVDTKAFVKQLEWLKGQGYHFVSVDDILADRAGSKPLPEKSVLLSFDDGYRSVYTNVFPVLKLFKAPAVIALVGHWLEVPDGQLVQYGNEKVPRSNFLSWQQIRELQASGLVEVASHSYDLHFGQVANPQGNQLPAATSQAYKGDRYETHEEYLARVRADLQRNREILKAHLGKAPRVMVWPYGSYSRETIRPAAELGMPVAMTLDDGANTRDTPLSALHRLLLDANMKLSDFSYQFKKMERAVQSEQ
ncbi:poly-beta-1,6-N-acetyl-D-glucosamine N-deacetylase PgaB [Paludibacterium denitrificans]|uniref:poly-beta-1,6-N-acetyl-D-glucosamine N-deacetylase PgaB n=1 Tax=Paludibacterium denitrificans TaxID=2675226 RepID=UPI001E2A251E|nr:poly-beta-1,6-N-acetyl-D-glucosamine N-deacetylase PgaB [Paludibacterium denitrificans]